MIDRYPKTTAEREKALAQIDPDTRHRIEDAARVLFAEREFHRVKLIDVARHARISLQTLYKYYGSKETVLFASLDTWLSTLARRMIDHLQGIENFRDRLRKVFWVLLDYFERNPEVAQIILSSVYLNTWREDDTFRQPQLMSVFLGVIEEGRHCRHPHPGGRSGRDLGFHLGRGQPQRGNVAHARPQARIGGTRAAAVQHDMARHRQRRRSG